MATRKSVAHNPSKTKLPSKPYRILVSFFVAFYILFSLQASCQLAMKVKWFKVWPWHAWNMFQRSSSYNVALKAEGITQEGTIVELDLDQIFKYRRGGYKKGRYSEMHQLRRSFGRYNKFKDRFSEYVVEKYNAQVQKDAEKLEILDLYRYYWPKSLEPKEEDLRVKLVHRWQNEKTNK